MNGGWRGSQQGVRDMTLQSDTFENSRKHGVSWFDVNADCVADREFINLKEANAFYQKMKSKATYGGDFRNVNIFRIV